MTMAFWKKRHEEKDWRDQLRGTFGNTGRLGRAAYNRGGVGAGESEGKGEAFDLEERRADEERPNEQTEGSEPRGARWADNFGPRGFSGGFAGREYSWKRRGEQ